MEEITIKVNKTVLYSAGFLIVGVIVGLTLGNFVNVSFSKKDNGGQVVLNNQPSAPAPSGEAPAPAAVKISIKSDDHIRGAKKPKVYLVEYSDFQCPFCQRHFPTLQKVLQNYANDVSLVYRHFPLSFHQNAQIAAEASECASEQGKFWEYHDVLFQKGQGDGTGLTPPELEQYAKQLGLNSGQFDNCLAAKKYATKVNADLAQGSALGVQGTPATFVVDKDGNAELVSGAVPYEALKAAIDNVLK